MKQIAVLIGWVGVAIVFSGFGMTHIAHARHYILSHLPAICISVILEGTVMFRVQTRRRRRDGASQFVGT